jgi:hypothetical protein
MKRIACFRLQLSRRIGPTHRQVLRVGGQDGFGGDGPWASGQLRDRAGKNTRGQVRVHGRRRCAGRWCRPAGGWRVISAVIMSSTEEKAAHSSINHRVGHSFRVTVTAARPGQEEHSLASPGSPCRDRAGAAPARTASGCLTSVPSADASRPTGGSGRRLAPGTPARQQLSIRYSWPCISRYRSGSLPGVGGKPRFRWTFHGPGTQIEVRRTCGSRP